MAATTVHPSAIVDDGAQIGDGTRVWHFGARLPGARIGEGLLAGAGRLRRQRRRHRPTT
jgi:UDP-2-acetamido-3-amino-2,3-dideoxy-glucuronate N-acetyltransferase